jgi:hypothetical protein
MLSYVLAAGLGAGAIFQFYNDPNTNSDIFKTTDVNDDQSDDGFIMSKFENEDKLENINNTIVRDYKESKKRGVFIQNLKSQDSLHNPSAWRQQNIYLPANNGIQRNIEETAMDVSKANVLAAHETARFLLRPNTHSRWTMNKQLSSIMFPQSIGEGGLDLPNADLLEQQYPFFSYKNLGMNGQDKLILKRNHKDLRLTSTNGVSSIDTSTQTWTRGPLELVTTLNPFNPGGEAYLKSIEVNQINKTTIRPDAFQAF